MCIPRMLWVGKVGLKDGLKWPSSATGPSPLGSMGPRAGQVKTRTNYQVGQSVLRCSAQSPPLPHAHQTRHQPPATTVKSSLLRPMAKQSPPRHHHPPWNHLLPLARCQSLPMAPFPRAPRAVLPVLALSPAPTSPARPPPPSGHPWVGSPTLGPHWMPDLVHAKSASLPQPSFTAALVLTAARAA